MWQLAKRYARKKNREIRKQIASCRNFITDPESATLIKQESEGRDKKPRRSSARKENEKDRARNTESLGSD